MGTYLHFPKFLFVGSCFHSQRVAVSLPEKQRLIHKRTNVNKTITFLTFKLNIYFNMTIMFPKSSEGCTRGFKATEVGY